MSDNETGMAEPVSGLDARERFAQFAEEYVTSSSHSQGYDLDRLVELAGPRSHWDVLDIATGGGHTALKFAPWVAGVIATDITSEMLAAARKFTMGKGITNVQFGFADASDLPFEEGTFDLVTCRIAPHHFRSCSRFIHEGYRVLNDGGMLLVQDHLLPVDQASALYIDDFERSRDPSHNRAFNVQMWMKMFAAAGFVLEHLEEITKRHVLISWAERQGCSPDTITALKKLLVNAPPIAAEWLSVADIDTPKLSFVNHHILIAGLKRDQVCS